MFAPVFPCVPLHEGLLDNLLAAMGSGCAIWGPHVGADGVNRLQPMTEAQLPDLATLTCLPLKKLLLPPGEALWSCRDGAVLTIKSSSGRRTDLAAGVGPAPTRPMNTACSVNSGEMMSLS